MNDKNGNELKVGDLVMRIGEVAGFDGTSAIVRADGIDYYMPPGKLEKLPAPEPADGPGAQQLLAEIAGLTTERDELRERCSKLEDALAADDDRQTIRQLVEMLHRR